jgi:TPP-dependent pyruvate/acetoin dehydrogenase alpha subunit
MVNRDLFIKLGQQVDQSGYEYAEQKLISMLVIREFEIHLGKMSLEKQFQTPIHLTIGQEAIPVGVSAHLTSHDRVFGNHRSHGHYLSMGGSPVKLFSEVLGNADGCSSGKGGSMHISSVDEGFYGSMPIVAGTIPIAVGAALALKRKQGDNIAVAYFGDGATEEGVFYESLNLASSLNLPILFVCENNSFSSHLHLSLRRKNTSLPEIFESLSVPTLVVNGNDLTEILEKTPELISSIRKGKGPRLLFANTYRHYSHVGFEKDLDIGLNRKTDLKQWLKLDPIELFSNAIEGKFPQRLNLDLKLQETRDYISECWKTAMLAMKPLSTQVSENVYWSKQ